MNEPDLVPASDLLGDLELSPLPEEVVPFEAIVLVKALDEDGDAAWYVRYTAGIGHAEAVGELAIQHALALQEAVDGYMPCYMDDEEDDGGY